VSVFRISNTEPTSSNSLPTILVLSKALCSEELDS
jgi:hypothetical protein